jgi:uncharacterized damage-inducible protein DinB
VRDSDPTSRRCSDARDSDPTSRRCSDARDSDPRPSGLAEVVDVTLEPPDVNWPARDADERTMLEGYLDAYRSLAVRKVAGLTQEQLAIAHPPTTMTLGGILKHLAVVEDDWFHSDLAGNDFPEPWASVPADEIDDWEWTSAANDSPEELRAIFDAACARSRAACADVASLDAMSVKTDGQGRPWSLRWIYVHLIEEYARHVGHADLIRESIDGSTGD